MNAAQDIKILNMFLSWRSLLTGLVIVRLMSQTKTEGLLFFKKVSTFFEHPHHLLPGIQLGTVKNSFKRQIIKRKLILFFLQLKKVYFEYHTNYKWHYIKLYQNSFVKYVAPNHCFNQGSI